MEDSAHRPPDTRTARDPRGGTRKIYSPPMDAALATIYTAHVTMNKLRYDLALGASQFDHAVVFSGGLHYQYLDDMPYPFKVNPHFKGWAPVADNPNCFLIYTPGVKPKLVYFQPVDYWHKVAGTPTDRWVEKF